MANAPRLRPAVLAARERLATDRQKLREQHDRGTPGIQLCSHLTNLLDEVVLSLYESAASDFGHDNLLEDIALIAHGGYGRRDVAPYSDVDLMLLCSPAAYDHAADVAKYLSRDICDAGLQLGFSLRTPSQACSLGMQDASIFTSLAESRLLRGNERLFDRFRSRYRTAARRRWRFLVSSIIASRKKERQQYGETTHLLQPNVKRTRGGLRDIQMVRWIGFTRYGEAGLQRLDRIGALPTVDRRRLLQAHEFLLRLRNEMHFHAEQSQDLLTREEQVRIADRFNYQPLDKVLPVERFMRDYFEETSEVRYISSSFIDGVRARSGLAAAAGSVFSHRVEGDFRVGPVHISATRHGLEKVSRDLSEVLRLMDLANMYQKRIDHRTWETIRTAMAQRPVQEISDEVVNRFRSLLSQPGRLGNLLRRLHQLRVLEQIIPAMQHARHLMQFNDYHKYTVDEHSIRAVEAATNFLHDSRPIGTAYRELRNKQLLHLALLIHDLGKGYDDDHSEVGALIAVDVASRLKLSENDADTLKFLVAKHLSMSHMAFREDMHDESVILRLAHEVGSTDVLQMLYILSAADLAAVGPKVLNDWKLNLLTDLYFRTRSHLTGESVSHDGQNMIDERREAIRKRAAEVGQDSWWDEQIAALPDSYLRSISSRRLFEILKQLKSVQSQEAFAWFRYTKGRQVSTYLIGTTERDTPGIFHKLTGALTAKGLSILSAEIHTLADGVVLDRFFVDDTDFEGEPPAVRTEEVCNALVRALTSDAGQAPTFRRVWSSPQEMAAATFAGMPTRVRFDDTTSDQYTIVTVFTYDRRGLLYTISRTLYELGLQVHVAKIGTYLDQVVDVFYVTDDQQRKIYSQTQRNEIRHKLEEALESLQ